jgi:hypothetical protein
MDLSELYQENISDMGKELEAHVALISLLEPKAPDFAQYPSIRSWLDRWVFQKSRPLGVNYTDLKGDWSHLM